MLYTKWYFITRWPDLVNSSTVCWTLSFCELVGLSLALNLLTLLQLFSSVLPFSLAQVGKWQFPSHKVKCILTFWFHCLRQPFVI